MADDTDTLTTAARAVAEMALAFTAEVDRLKAERGKLARRGEDLEADRKNLTQYEQDAIAEVKRLTARIRQLEAQLEARPVGGAAEMREAAAMICDEWGTHTALALRDAIRSIPLPTTSPSTEPALHDLIEHARHIVPTPAQREEQRRSFAYGNTKIENPNITRAMIDAAADGMSPSPSTEPDAAKSWDDAIAKAEAAGDPFVAGMLRVEKFNDEQRQKLAQKPDAVPEGHRRVWVSVDPTDVHDTETKARFSGSHALGRLIVAIDIPTTVRGAVVGGGR